MFIWEGVSEFVAVAEAESFTAAAKRLGISTAQVSRQVSALESRLSTKLLYRTTRKVSVTEAGQTYYQYCRQVLDGLEEAEWAMTNLQLIPKGKLRLTAPVTYGEKVIAPLVNDFILRYLINGILVTPFLELLQLHQFILPYFDGRVIEISPRICFCKKTPR